MSDKNKKLFGWLDFGSTMFGNAANILMTLLTNKKNQQLADAERAMQIAESEKAYERGKPINQVAQLRAAGMSKAAALNTISGGSSYTPAPIASHSAESPQVDLTNAFDGLVAIGENAKQRKAAEDLQNAQIAAAKEQQQKQIESEEKKHKESLESQERIARENRETQRYGIDKNFEQTMASLGFQREQWDFMRDAQKASLLQSVENARKDGKIKDAELKKVLYDIEEYQSKENRSARDAETLLRKVNADSGYLLSYKNFVDYRNRNYYPVYENGEIVSWLPRELNAKDSGIEYISDRFWEMLGSILPVDYLIRIVGSVLK